MNGRAEEGIEARGEGGSQQQRCDKNCRGVRVVRLGSHKQSAMTSQQNYTSALTENQDEYQQLEHYLSL
jgi:hypothetical protein